MNAHVCELIPPSSTKRWSKIIQQSNRNLTRLRAGLSISLLNFTDTIAVFLVGVISGGTAVVALGIGSCGEGWSAGFSTGDHSSSWLRQVWSMTVRCAREAVGFSSLLDSTRSPMESSGESFVAEAPLEDIKSSAGGSGVEHSRTCGDTEVTSGRGVSECTMLMMWCLGSVTWKWKILSR